MPQVLKSSVPTRKAVAGHGLLGEVDRLSAVFSDSANPARRSELGQYPTSWKIAIQMAAMFRSTHNAVRLLDPGAGVGTLTAAYVSRVYGLLEKPKKIEATAFEIDIDLVSGLSQTLAKCGEACFDARIAFDGQIHRKDFIIGAVEMIESGLFGGGGTKFDCAILNPPYKKISTDSEHRRLLRRIGIETSNLYSAFLALTILLLKPGGELVAITPRSFCNGPYFKPFREMLLREMSLVQIHVFESRTEAFSEDDVLQENVIIHALKTREKSATILISSSRGPNDAISIRKVAIRDVVKPGDPERFIHIVADESGGKISEQMDRLSCTLADVGLSVSTGRVVDFRCREHVKREPSAGTVPLIYPMHFSGGFISWPKSSQKKCNAFISNEESAKWLIPSAIHVLTKRFSAKEEKRRIVAAIFDPSMIPCEKVAFENHVNYFHDQGGGLPLDLAKGLTAYLNSTAVDAYFRQFNGHTQVNASDLRNLRYPTCQELQALGAEIGDSFPDQQELDRLIEKGFSTWRKRLGELPSKRFDLQWAGRAKCIREKADKLQGHRSYVTKKTLQTIHL